MDHFHYLYIHLEQQSLQFIFNNLVHQIIEIMAVYFFVLGIVLSILHCICNKIEYIIILRVLVKCILEFK